MSAQPFPRVTAEEYLALDRSSPQRHEYYDGVVYAMAGGSVVHARIITNTVVALAAMLRNRGCEVFGSDLRVRVAERQCYSYPDVTVVCGNAQTATEQNDTLLNPTVLVEVLSKSTEAHDRGLKFTRYRSLPSLSEYVLIAQHEPRVEVYRRQPWDKWLLTEYHGLDSVCRLESIECELLLAAIYDNVSFEESVTYPYRAIGNPPGD